MNYKIGFIMYFLVGFSLSHLLGQRCGTTSPLVLESSLKNITKSANKRGIKEFNIVFHIVFQNEEENIPDSRIYSQLEVLNRIFQHYDPRKNAGIPEEFRDNGKTPGIKFCLASIDPKGRKTNGITRTKTTIDDIGCRNEFGRKNIMTSLLGGIDPWDPKKYVNIFVGSRKNCPPGEAIFPWQATDILDGIIIDPHYFGLNSNNFPFHLGYTLIHEFGHYAGLLHLSVNSDPADCSQDDQINDTPPQSVNYFDCPDYPQYSCNRSSMFMNFMSLVNDPCMQLFTEEQVTRMHQYLELYRTDLANLNCQSSIAKALSIRHLPQHGNQWLIESEDMTIWSSKIRLWDLNGKMIVEEEFIENQRILFPRNSFNLESSIYLIQIVNGEFNTTFKVISMP
ncbi:MAG: hypothetical protein IPI90_09205 [Saprospiraceae bacterium]|nr:hypothetical protein [Candidatus Vicinibacter affinis]